MSTARVRRLVFRRLLCLHGGERLLRRPHTTRQVFDAIGPATPQRLYVACDVPNPDRPEEAETVAVAACSGGSGSISCFFEQEEEEIILEDDIEVDTDFFS